MTDTPNDAIVLEDSDGHYYVIPHELIELTRVEAEAKEEISGKLEDVSGYTRVGVRSYRVCGKMRLLESSHFSLFRSNVGWPDDSPKPQGLPRFRQRR